MVINFALVESDLESNVTAGENEGAISLSLKTVKGIRHASVIAYVQNEQDMHILAAASIDLK